MNKTAPTDQKFIVRPARKGEWPKIKRLISLYPKFLLQKNLPRLPSFFVVLTGDKIVGCCALEIYSKRIAELRSLSVHSDYQGKGLGSLLVTACVKKAKRKRIKEMFAITGRLSLFRRFGFNTFSSEKFALIKMLREN